MLMVFPRLWTLGKGATPAMPVPARPPKPDGFIRRLHLGFAVFVLITSGVFAWYLRSGSAPELANAQASVQRAFAEISPVPGATAVEHNEVRNPGAVLEGATYQVNTKYTNIRQYYDAQLLATGWQ